MNDYMNTEISDQTLITEWLNNASFSQDVSEKLEILHKLHEFLIRKAPNLLPEYLPSVLNFTTDSRTDIKKALVNFIEEACKVNETLLPKVMMSLYMLLCVNSAPVQKRVIQAVITLYRRMLSWLCKVQNITSEMEDAWNKLNVIKEEIATMVNSDNDGIRTSSVKFLECVVLLQTYPDPIEPRPPTDFSLENIPLTLKLIRRRKLEEEAQVMFGELITFNGSQHVSCANLFACIGILTNIAKNRPTFMGQVITAIELLHSNLPPTLSTTQVNTIQKKLKSELSSLIKHHAAYDYAETICTILVDLGIPLTEVQKMAPKIDESRRNAKRMLQEDSQLERNSKRTKFDETLVDEATEQRQKQATETNVKFVTDRLNLDTVVQLVMSALPKAPNVMPNQFKIDYTAFMKMGHVGDSKVLAKMLAIQLLEAGLGPGADTLKGYNVIENSVVEKVAPVAVVAKKKEVIEEEVQISKKERLKVPRVKTLKLAEITKPLEKSFKERLLLNSIDKILLLNSSGPLQKKILVTLGTSFSNAVRAKVMDFLVADLKENMDVVFSMLMEEYSIMQGFTRLPVLRRDGHVEAGYNSLLIAFIDHSFGDSVVLSRLFLEAPLITDQAIKRLSSICHDEKDYVWALNLLKSLVIHRPPKQSAFLNVLLSHSTYESSNIQDCAIVKVVELYQRQNLKSTIEKFVRLHLDFLRLPQPPLSLYGESQGRIVNEAVWNDDLVRSCLNPYVSLLHLNHSMIHELARIYVQTNADMKRVILRLLETPIRLMGMESIELLKLVEECPKGSETLVTRIIHILTDKGQPSAQLVQHVRELYQTRVSDVRFLIPVLNGLTKVEVIAALPKLIKLNPVVVKEVFNRLLGLHGDSPITPTELLVSLHLIDPTKADLKTTMKATSMCLSEKQIFTQEVLAVVLQQLMEQSMLPTLLMRTVIQALGSYPRLSGFVMNILQRLILKQVWKHKVVWEGFIKCCQRTKPQSFPVLMQLPAPQLLEVISMCPDLYEPLKQYLLNFTESQRAQVPTAIQEILLENLMTTPPMLDNSTPPPAIPESVPMPILSMEPLPPGME